MGLFSNNKKLCPICGSPTPRLLATKVADMPLCKACADKVDLPGGALDRMSLEQFQQYIAYYDDNKALRDQFRETKRMSFGFLSGDLLVDEEHRLLRLKGYDGALVFPAAALKSFRFMEDGKTLFEGKPDGLHCFHSDVPERARSGTSLWKQCRPSGLPSNSVLPSSMKRKDFSAAAGNTSAPS